jgi:hypothetical protein
MSNPTTKSTIDAGNDEWNQAADRAKEAAACVGEMATHAVSAASTMAGQAACDAGRKADDLTARAGAGMQTFADRLAKQAPQQGAFGTASQSAAQALQEGGQYLESAKLSGVAEDFANLVRQNPLPAILIAVGLGWFIGRKL